ncbi:MAG: asparagine synthase (glutamine-hydrolyzing) [Candidatus Methylomirabilales bacterium]
MCGIVGLRELGQNRIDPDLLLRMRETMVHRGPDDGGLYVSHDGTCGLAHRRLSIVDLSPAGHQPMPNEDESIWIVFNGEIYNHREIKRKLEANGHRYRSQTDTESIIHLYEEKGVECLHELRGMFAFAIWDANRRRLFLARDRLGVKPLYYTFQNGRFLFSSEIKAILEDPMIERDIDPEALYHYLTFLTAPAPTTLFKGINKLPAGYYLTMDERGEVKHLQYWDAIIESDPLTSSEEWYAEEIRKVLSESIGLRMMSDVPFGVFLSGGIDSSTNVALMAALMDRPVKTFTVGFKNHETWNELHHARRIAELFKSDHHEVLIDHRDLLDFLPKLIYHQDEPIADPVCVPLYFVSKLAKDNGVIVIQVGEGSDELFCGYPAYMKTLDFHRRGWRQLMAIPPPLRRMAFLGLFGLSRLLHRGFHLRDNLRKAVDGEELFWGGAIVFAEMDKKLLLSESFKRACNDLSSYEVIRPYYQKINKEKPEADFLERMIYLELKLRLPELLLMRVDKITMATSVEARVPFLDHKLVEFALPIPPSVKIKDQTKYILKRSVEGLIPDDIIYRRKQGFGAPVREWFFEAIGGYVREALLHSSIRERDFFDYAYVEAILNAHLAGKGDNSAFLWNLLNLSLWYDHWIAGRVI